MVDKTMLPIETINTETNDLTKPITTEVFTKPTETKESKKSTLKKKKVKLLIEE